MFSCARLLLLGALSLPALAQGSLPETVPSSFLNLTALQESLFSKYDKLSRPLAGTPNQTVIQCQLRLNKFQDLDPLTGSFTMDLYLRLQWVDPRLVFNTSILEGEALHITPDLVWKPDIYFYNEAEPGMQALDFSLKLKAGGQMFWSRHFLMNLGADLDLRQFPFDSQDLPLQLVPYSYDNTTMLLEFMTTGAVYPDPLTDPDSPLKADLWAVNGISDLAESFNEIAGQTDYSRLTVTISVSRKPIYYITRYIIPLVFIALASSAQYWIDPAAVSTRVGVGVTLLLAIVSFMFLLSADLPKVSYATRMDQFVLACFFFVFFGLAEFALVHSLSEEHSHNASTSQRDSDHERDGSILLVKKQWFPVLLDVSLRFIQPLAVVLACLICFLDLSTGQLVGFCVAFGVLCVITVFLVYRMILVPDGYFDTVKEKGH
ncbi:hypothetical protein HDU98_004046 [Podochytrium sp. JEL0797]|nr:hypothetical protein HDU98_004046 [Podochytrium sp. JEL0797]